MTTKKDDIEQFKRDLKSVSYYNRKLIRLNEDIEYAEHCLTGLARQSVTMTKEQEKSSLPMPHYQGGGRSLVDRIFEIDLMKEEAKKLQERILSCEAIDYLADEQRDLLMEVFVFRKNLYDKAEEMDISRSGLIRRLNRIIGQIV